MYLDCPSRHLWRLERRCCEPSRNEISSLFSHNSERHTLSNLMASLGWSVVMLASISTSRVVGSAMMNHRPSSPEV